MVIFHSYVNVYQRVKDWPNNKNSTSLPGEFHVFFGWINSMISMPNQLSYSQRSEAESRPPRFRKISEWWTWSTFSADITDRPNSSGNEFGFLYPPQNVFQKTLPSWQWSFPAINVHSGGIVFCQSEHGGVPTMIISGWHIPWLRVISLKLTYTCCWFLIPWLKKMLGE